MSPLSENELLNKLISGQATSDQRFEELFRRLDKAEGAAAEARETAKELVTILREQDTGGRIIELRGELLAGMAEPGPEPRVLLADKGFDAHFIRGDLEARDITALIPARRNRKVQPIIYAHVYAHRNLVERCFSKLKHRRRLAVRYDKTANSHLGIVLVASIRLCIRHFVHTA